MYLTGSWRAPCDRCEAAAEDLLPGGQPTTVRECESSQSEDFNGPWRGCNLLAGEDRDKLA